MSKTTKTAPTEGIEGLLKSQTESLKLLVDKGDFGEAMKVITELNQTRDASLYQEVGKLTRSLHQAIRNFQIDVGGHNTEQAEELSKITDASDRLSYVVEQTNKAANKTMDIVEATMPVASQIRSESEILRKDWARLRRREMNPDEFRELYKRMDTFLEQLNVQANTVYGGLSDILLAQDFQDLTGQVIKRVTTLVKEVEENLVNLVLMASHVDKMTGVTHEYAEAIPEDAIKGEGPQINAETRKDVVKNQDDVDDLLASLGF